MEKQLKYFLIIAALFLFIDEIVESERFTAKAQLCSTTGETCVDLGTGQTGMCVFDPVMGGLKCETNPSLQQFRGCRSGQCVILPELAGSGADLCQSDSSCVYRICAGNVCLQRNAPGPGIRADECQDNNDCQSPRYKCVSTSCVRDDTIGTYMTSNCNNQCVATSVPPGGDDPPVPPGGKTGVSIPNPIGPGTFQDLIERIARYLFQIGIPIAVIMILYAAYLYVTSGGSEEKVTKAHKALTYAVVGLGILFLAWGITSLVKELLGG